MLQRGGCAVSEVSKFVLHASGNLGVDGASEQAVVFETLEGLGQHLGADAFQASFELPVALRPVFERTDGQGAPLVGVNRPGVSGDLIF